MEAIRSRQNELVKHFIALGSDPKARQAAGKYICAGDTLLGEAVSSGAEVTCVLSVEDIPGLPVRLVTPEILKAVSPLQISPGQRGHGPADGGRLWDGHGGAVRRLRRPL